MTRDTHGFTYDHVSTPLHRFTHVETTVNASEPASDYYWWSTTSPKTASTRGISNVQMVQPPPRDAQH